MPLYVLTWVSPDYEGTATTLLGVYSSHIEAVVAASVYKSSLAAKGPIPFNDGAEISIVEVDAPPAEHGSYMVL